MATTHQTRVASRVTDDDLRRMVGPDPVRPGPSRYRILTDDVDVPIWPIIGQLIYAYGWDPDSKRPQVDLVLSVAREYDVPPLAVEAAILYYHEHRGTIDALHAANNAALA